MKIVTLCGSLKYQKEMMKLAEMMTLEGYCILTPIYPTISGAERTEEEIIKLKARIAKLVADILRSEGMLNNPNFVAKAPAQKVEAEKNNVASYKEQLKEAEKVLKGLEK